MKKLILVRHAKSDWGNESLKDMDRPLNQRGYQDAYIMAKWCKENLPMPDLMVSSHAIRAISTSFIFARTLERKEDDVKIENGLYESTMPKWLKIIGEFENKSQVVMVFGHNPVITNLVNELSKELFFDNLPTCSVVGIELGTKDWKNISEIKNAKLISYKFPKSFKQ